MMNQNLPFSPDRVAQFILVRLLAAGKPPTASIMDHDLKRYFANPVSMPTGQWHELLDQALRTLQESKLIQAKPFRLTDQGRSVAQEFIFGASPRLAIVWPNFPQPIFSRQGSGNRASIQVGMGAARNCRRASRRCSEKTLSPAPRARTNPSQDSECDSMGAVEAMPRD